MPFFRLFNPETLKLEQIDSHNHPPYIAASHVWSEQVFDLKDGFPNCFGGRGMGTVIEQIHPDIRYCWFDTLCENQEDEQEKLSQIPLMDRIYGKADAVVMFINAHLGVSQGQVDHFISRLDSALAMCKEDAWQEEGAYWQNGDGRDLIVQAMQGLLRLASTDWAKRVRTLQEHVLAKSVVWIGLDLQPLRFDDFVLSALPDICDTLAITECLGSDMEVKLGYFQGMATVRLGTVDVTRIMALLGNRKATMPVDEVYGVMAVSRVIIDAILSELKSSAWNRWWEAAVTQGHHRWILLPSNGGRSDEGEVRNCIMPKFSGRHELSGSSCLDGVNQLGSITVSNGCVTALTRRLGTAKIVERLGKVHEAQNGRLHRDITLVLFARAKCKLALQLASAFGGGRYNLKEATVIARVLTRSYTRAVKKVVDHDEEALKPVLSSRFELFVWNDFMSLQQSQMIGLNDGIGYLCQVMGESLAEQFIAVLVGGDNVATSGNLEVLDFQAQAPDGRFVLVVVAPSNEIGGSAHKVGMTLPVSDDLTESWSCLPMVEIKIGGQLCSQCNGSIVQDGSDIQKWSSLPSTHATRQWNKRRLGDVRVLERRLELLIRKIQKTDPSFKSPHSTESRRANPTRSSRRLSLRIGVYCRFHRDSNNERSHSSNFVVAQFNEEICVRTDRITLSKLACSRSWGSGAVRSRSTGRPRVSASLPRINLNRTTNIKETSPAPPPLCRAHYNKHLPRSPVASISSIA